MSDETWMKGWVCPQCKGIFSPLQRYCPECTPNSPAYFVIPDDVSLTPNQIRELQDALRALCVDLDWNHKLIVLPPKSKIISEWNI